jgi:hydroxypyruvate isomerase
MMFTEVPLAQRFKAAANKGFSGVELLFPYTAPASQLSELAEEAGIQLILINTPLGDAGTDDRGTAAVPGREAEFREQFELALTYARACKVGLIHTLAGVVQEAQWQAAREVFIDNIRWAADKAHAERTTLLLEPLNSQDVPGYFHATSAVTVDLLNSIDRPNVKLQFDFYHLQIMEGNLGVRLQECFADIGHVQFSSVPGRHEPQYGEVNAPILFDLLDELGYAGWVGSEYRPLTTTEAGLSWAKPYGIG